MELYEIAGILAALLSVLAGGYGVFKWSKSRKQVQSTSDRSIGIQAGKNIRIKNGK